MPMVKKVLVANRGEIALRIIRACRELGIQSVAVHSDVDAHALHVRFADEAICIGPADPTHSYLKIPSIIAAAEVTGADAIHPGYGFLAENAEFAEICEQCGLNFIGPKPRHMRDWGSKVEARELAESLGLPLMKGSGVLDTIDDALAAAEKVGYPVMLKASAGGGGRGMKVLRSADELRRAFPQAKREAEMSFKNGDLYCERYVEKPRHIEFQVLCDGRENVWVLGERECSIQRRHQKLIEEAPSAVISTEKRQAMVALIRKAMLETGYVSAGTLEFLLDEKGDLYFMEMNTRIQVEHPVTELVMGVDIVAEQLRIAAGEAVHIPDCALEPRGHALECRINAECPDTDVPWPGLITAYHPPGGAGVRIDEGIYAGWRVPKVYDSLLLKLITYGKDRPEAVNRMRRALGELVIEGIRTNAALHRRIMLDPDFIAAELSTRFMENLRAELKASGERLHVP